jgi:hypothetical protein
VDGGGEYRSTIFKEWLLERHIRLTLTDRGTSWMNGVAERAIRTIFTRTLSLVTQANLPLKYWRHALHHAIWLHNLVPSSRRSPSSPYEAVHGFQPALNDLKPFGCMVQVFIPKKFRDHRLLPRTHGAIFVGYESPSIAKLLDLATGKLSTSHLASLQWFTDIFPNIGPSANAHHIKAFNDSMWELAFNEHGDLIMQQGSSSLKPLSHFPCVIRCIPSIPGPSETHDPS